MGAFFFYRASASDGDCGEDENASTVDASDTVTVTSAIVANNDVDEKIDMADETGTETKQSIYVRQRNESPNTRKARCFYCRFKGWGGFVNAIPDRKLNENGNSRMAFFHVVYGEEGRYPL